MSKKDELKTPSVFAFERKLDPSDALMSSGTWSGNAFKPIALREKSIRGTISNRLGKKDASDPAKLDAKIDKPNLQRVDIAALPEGHDTARVRFTLRLLGDVGAPSVCNNSSYRIKLKSYTDAYKERHGFEALAERYAYNLASGRFLWRNRVSAENVRVEIKQIVQGVEKTMWRFDDALSFSLRHFDAPAEYAHDVKSLADAIAKSLSGNGYALFEVTAYARMGSGQEVFPSQELVLDSKEDKSKILYSVGDCAAMHSQKIGNAIRTIDTWYPDHDDDEAGVGPIAIEPYGSVTSLGKAFRQPKVKVDFYNLLDKWMLDDHDMADHEMHYLMAILIRGGVFGEAEKSKD